MMKFPDLPAQTQSQFPYFDEFLFELYNKVENEIKTHLSEQPFAENKLFQIIKEGSMGNIEKNPKKYVKQITTIIVALIHDEIILFTSKLRNTSLLNEFIQKVNILEVNNKKEIHSKEEIQQNFQTLYKEICESANLVDPPTPIIDLNTFYFNKLLIYAFSDWKICLQVLKLVKSVLSKLTLRTNLLLPFIIDLGVSEEAKQIYGQFFTPIEVADFICRQNITRMTNRVIDIACGTGIFLLRSLELIKEIASEDKRIELIGIEKDLSFADIAESALNFQILSNPELNVSIRILREDFFKCNPDSFLMSNKKVINSTFLMNPPYTRQELISSSYKHFLHRLLTDNGFSISRRSSLYVYFIIHATRFLENGDRMGIIVPNSWLDVEYGLYLQKFILKHYFIKCIINCLSEQFIPSVEVNTAIMNLIRREVAPNQNDEIINESIKFISLNKVSDLHYLPIKNRSKKELMNSRIKILSVGQNSLKSTFKWGLYHRASENYFNMMNSFQKVFTVLKDVAFVRRGYTTGANDFFYISKPGKANKYFSSSWNPQNGDLYLNLKNNSVIKQFEEQGFSPRTPMFIIEKEYWMHQENFSDEAGKLDISLNDNKKISWIPNYLVKSSKNLLTYEIKEKDVNHVVILIKCSSNKEELKPGVKRYIEWGEKWIPKRGKRFHLRPTCQSRKFWYQLNVEESGPFNILCQMTINDRFTFFYNPLNFQFDARLYGIQLQYTLPNYNDRMQQYFLFLNSIITTLQLELLGRSNLGEGGLDIKVYEYEELKVPNIQLLSSHSFDSFKSIFIRLLKHSPFSILRNKPTMVKDIINEYMRTLLSINQEKLDALYLELKEIVQMRVAKAK